MPANVGNGSFNTGRDCQVVLINTLTQQRVDLPNVTSFEADQITKSVEIDRLDGVQLFAELPKGWHGSFENERSGSGLDRVIADTETAWFAGGVVTNWSLYQYVSEPDGSTSTFQFDSAAIKYAKAGKWTSDASIKQMIEFKANRRKMV